VLANLENGNALYIGKGISQLERIEELNRIDRLQMAAIVEMRSVKDLKAMSREYK
jgi:hypothetical protein